MVPRDAATVILLRQGRGGPEVYLLRRVTTMAFAAGMHVFPGGAVEPGDAATDLPWRTPPPAAWAGALSAAPGRVAALVSAAVRETFEECGVLLAAGAGGASEGDRRALVEQRLSFADLLRSRDLRLDPTLLHPWAHWLTPEHEARRFDTRFFLAAMPAGQQAGRPGGEADAAAWMSPVAAIQAYEDGRLAMLPPTVACLRDVAAYPTVAAALGAAPGRTIRPVRPRWEAADDGSRRLVVEP